MGVIDVGSNSVRMVVFDGAARSPAYFYNEKVMCELGRACQKQGSEPRGAQTRIGRNARFVQMARAMEVPKLTAVATAAVGMPKTARNFASMF